MLTPATPRVCAARTLGFALLATVALAAGASAREPGSFAQAEWAQDYASPAAMQVQRSSTPILSPQTVAATEQMVERYKEIVSRGGWRPVS
ncbi:murein L,D-transpeptidase, partial [Methylobacterium trifolii]